MRAILWAVAAVILCASAGALAQSSDASTDPVAARVDGHEIRQSDVARAFQRLPQQARQLPFALIYPQLVDQLIANRLMAQAGRSQQLGDTEAVRRQVAMFEDFVIQQHYLQRYLDQTLTNAVLRQRYDETVGEQVAEQEVHARHILLESEAVAREVLAELDGGRKFAELARDRSIGPSASRGGDLGYFRREQMAPSFSEAAFAMAAGETSKEPVQTQFGWHIIRVIDKRDVGPASFANSVDTLRQEMGREVLVAHLAELRAVAAIEVFNIDGSPRQQAPAANQPAPTK